MTYTARPILFALHLAVLGATAGSLALGCKSAGAEKAGAEKSAPAERKLFSLAEEQLATSLRVPGELVSYERVDLYAKVSSFVRKVNADVGSEVEAGTLLATLEAPELVSQLAESDSNEKAQESLYVASKASYDRLLRASETPGTVSANDLEQAEAKVKADRARLDGAKAAKRAVAALSGYLELRAPFAGVVTARNVSPGAYVGPAGRGSEAPLFTLQQQKTLRLVVSVPESRTGSVALGDEISFSVRSRPGERFVAKVSRLAGAVDAKLRAERVEMNVDNADRRLLPGTVADVTIPLRAPAQRFVVPRAAVIDGTTGTFVVRADDGKARWVPVELGVAKGDKVEVFGELTRGEQLVAKVGEELRDGADLGPTKLVDD